MNLSHFFIYEQTFVIRNYIGHQGRNQGFFLRGVEINIAITKNLKNNVLHTLKMYVCNMI